MPESYNCTAPSTQIKSPLWQTHLTKIERFNYRTAITASRDVSQGKISLLQVSSVPQILPETNGICVEPQQKRKSFTSQKTSPLGLKYGCGNPFFKQRIYSSIFMRKCYIALKEFCLKISQDKFMSSSVTYFSSAVTINAH